jgi:phenylacetate-CoA ligase
MDEYLRLISHFGIHFLHGYPSAIAILAAHAVRRAWHPPDTLIGVLPISESLLFHQRELIQRAFGGIAVLPFYGQSEKVAIAGEVPGVPDCYEFEPLYGHVELVSDDGEAIVKPGQVGRIIATGFLSRAMPLLRYDTGDTAELVRLATYDNCQRMRVRAIRSRWGQEFLVGRNGALISIAAINVHSPVYVRMREFQFYQERAGEADVIVVPLPGYKDADIQPFIDEISSKVGASIQFRLRLSSSTATNTRGKRPFVVQRLDTRQYMTPQSE